MKDKSNPSSVSSLLRKAPSLRVALDYELRVSTINHKFGHTLIIGILIDRIHESRYPCHNMIGMIELKSYLSSSLDSSLLWFL